MATDYDALAVSLGGKSASVDAYDGLANSLGGSEVRPERGAGEQLARGTGLGVRALAKGALSLGMLPLDAGIGIANLINKGTNAIGLTDATPFPSASSLTDQALTSLGLAEPQNGGERVASDVMSAATGAGGLARIAEAKAADLIAQRLAKTPGVGAGTTERVVSRMADAPAAQVAAGASSGLSAGLTRELGGGPVAQLLASLLGGMVPAAAQGAGAATLRGALRGGEQGRQQYNQNVDTFEQAGTTPTAGQAGNRVAQSVDALLSKVPGSAGRYAAKAQAESSDIGQRVNDLADSLIPNADAAKAGRTIEKGLASFVDRFKAEQNFLYDKLDQHIPQNAQVSVDNTKAALASLNADIPGAPNLSAWFKNAKIQGIEGAFKADTTNPRGLTNADAALENFFYGDPPPSLPYEAVKKLRTLVGNEISNTNLASTVPRDKWKALYAALSDDMGAAAKQAGPDAEAAFSRANWYTRAGYDRIESTLDRVGGKDTAEKVFQAAVNPSELREGATTINGVMRSLNPSERNVVTAATIKRLGQATPGNQNADGDAFSPSTFLTNWNKISDPAKMQLFPDQSVRAGLDAVAQSASLMRNGSKTFFNNSGTTASSVQIGATAAALLNPVLAVKIGTAIAAANGAARLMAKPEFVRWVGKTTQLSPGMLPGALDSLIAQADKWAPEDKAALQDFAARIR